MPSVVVVLPPHGSCWLWDYRLILLHGGSDLATFFAYSLIAITAMVVRVSGRLSGVSSSYPRLWILGSAFVGTCALSHLGNFAEIWYGGLVYWLTGVNKVAMATVSLWFAVDFWKVREDLVMIGRTLFAVMKEESR